ncbi:MAG: GGDEF domain-containing protein [Planctomycetes bacterium]|nr:GGDEF domain-containing protein [Planctomycetota bacterium]
MDDRELAYRLLQSFHFAVLRRTEPRSYRFFGQVPVFYNEIFPGTAGEPCVSPWDSSPMLEYFLEEAEAFFDREEPGFIDSGLWEEDGRTRENTALRALAVNLGEAQVIIIRLLEEEYLERLGILRKAREQLLENRQLNTYLSIFKEKSRIDGLTCIFNRTTFMELLLDEIKRSQILEYPLVLLILDIDNFKRVNDTYGHQAGDRVLHGMGSTLKNSLRRNDIVARYGGEEFAVLIPNAPMHEAVKVAEKIRCSLAAMTVENTPRVTVSIGCTAYTAGETPEDYFKRADDALYQAKKTGKNRVCIL